MCLSLHVQIFGFQPRIDLRHFVPQVKRDRIADEYYMKSFRFKITLQLCIFHFNTLHNNYQTFSTSLDICNKRGCLIFKPLFETLRTGAGERARCSKNMLPALTCLTLSDPHSKRFKIVGGCARRTSFDQSP